MHHLKIVTMKPIFKKSYSASLWFLSVKQAFAPFSGASTAFSLCEAIRFPLGYVRCIWFQECTYDPGLVTQGIPSILGPEDCLGKGITQTKLMMACPGAFVETGRKTKLSFPLDFNTEQLGATMFGRPVREWKENTGKELRNQEKSSPEYTISAPGFSCAWIKIYLWMFPSPRHEIIFPLLRISSTCHRKRPCLTSKLKHDQSLSMSVRFPSKLSPCEATLIPKYFSNLLPEMTLRYQFSHKVISLLTALWGRRRVFSLFTRQFWWPISQTQLHPQRWRLAD